MTNPADRETLLRIAREAIEAHVFGKRVRADVTGVLTTRSGGVFVTVYCRGELRGCIGHLSADRPLIDAVQDCARSAASADPRFTPIVAAELDQLDLELSLLGPLEPIDGPSDVEVGRHGLVVERDGRRGLLLPQVATEWNWNAETFLAHTCQKAGLPPGAWRHGAKMWRFEAEVFGDVRDGASDPSRARRPSDAPSR
jgi:AmmeMemoRadiSam system protein A